MIKHVSVMPQKAIDLLKIKEDGVYVDGTLGRGGHSKLILERLKKGKLYCFDLDEEAIKESKEVLKEYDNVIYIHDNYMNMNKYVDQADGILLDLGVSSPQFDEAVRGFSYRYDGPLDMRMDQSDELSAYEVVNKYDEERLAKVLYEYGEEKNAKRIARKIVEERPIETTLQLAEIVEKSVGRHGAHHPATRVFQALRMAVNDELGELSRALSGGLGRLKSGGRFVVITFESLTDRAVKRFFVSHAGRMVSLHQGGARWEGDLPRVRLVTRRAARPSTGEMERNPRSRSARLRVAERV